MKTKIDTTKYTDQTLVIPADICKIIERENLLNNALDDFDLSIEIVDGKVKITDMLEYIVKDFPSLEPEEAWGLVRKWWINLLEENKVEIAISKKQKEISKLQDELVDLEEVKKDWRFWK